MRMFNLNIITSNMDIVIDFDGTCVSHEYPDVGKDIGAVPVLKELVESGHNLILFTMRSGEKLEEAVGWFEENNIPLFGIQTNPTQSTWTSSPKAYGQLYIDDAALGIPLVFNPEATPRPFVDWIEVRRLLAKRDLLVF